MASGLPLPVVVVVVMALLLQSASATVEPNIEMVVVNNNDNKENSISSNNNGYCHYQMTVRTSGWVLGSGTDSTLRFELRDRYYNGASVTQDGRGAWFEANMNDVIQWDGPCIGHPCELYVTTDGTGYNADWLMSWLEVVITGGPAGTETATFFNGQPGSDGGKGSPTWLGPNNKRMEIDICPLGSMQQQQQLQP